MKHLKRFGLAAIAAAALFAYLGVGSASATVFCTTNDLVCEKGWDEPAGTKIDTSSKGSWQIKNPSLGTLLTCTEVTEKGTMENTGGANMQIRWNPEEVSYKGCNKTPPKRPKFGWWGFNSTSSSGNASITGHEMEITLEISGVSCTYGAGEGTSAGTFEGGETPIMNINASLTKTAGSFLCPTNVEMVGQFFTTTPRPLWAPDSAK